MGSISFGEILVIVVVILVVFGPKRLPELSRQIGAWLTKAREATSYVAEAIDSGYGETLAPIRDLKDEFDGLKGDVTRAVASLGENGDTSQTRVTADESPPADEPLPADESPPADESGDGATEPADQ
ncbi:MAG: hypothetical protein BMS9Abin07_0203 [Acidimicrobiia bacterium]|nr:MAG: hypothetical protein BMS9Abin07_0203 [Acidimicrobiia bacterium]